MMKFKNKKLTAILFLQMLFIASGFALLSIRKGYFDIVSVCFGAGLIIFNLLQYSLMKAVFHNFERFALLVAQFLWSVGLIVLYRIDESHAVKQAIFLVISTVALLIVTKVISVSHDFGKMNWFFMVLAILLLGSTLVLSRAIGGAKNWINIGPFSFQPSEFAKILFLMGSAYFLSTRENLASFIPYTVFTGMCVILLVAAKELGTGLLICIIFLLLFYIAAKRAYLTLVGVGVFGLGAVASYKVFSHVRTRVQIWKNPWASYNNEGYQIVQGLLALASGGLFGVGLGNGMPQVIPAAHTDYIFAVIGEEFGIIFGIVLIVFYLVLIVRGILVALDTDSTYDALLSFGCTAMISVQAFIIIGGVIKLIPLTGITLPFVSYGGSSLLASMIQLGIIEGVSIKNARRDIQELQMMGAYDERR